MIIITAIMIIITAMFIQIDFYVMAEPGMYSRFS